MSKTPKRLSDADRARIKELSLTGMNSAQIAPVVGFSSPTVRRVLNPNYDAKQRANESRHAAHSLYFCPDAYRKSTASI